MPDGVTIEVKGLREANRKLYAYSQQLGDRVVLKSLREGAKVLQVDIKRRVPRITGRLRRSISIRNSKKARRTLNQRGVYVTMRPIKIPNSPKYNRYVKTYGRLLDQGYKPRGRSRRVEGRYFMKKAYNAKRISAARVSIVAIRRGADIVARRTGLD